MDKLHEYEFDEWAGVYLGDTQYELNIFPNEHGELIVTVYPMRPRDPIYINAGESDVEVDTLNPVASGKLDIFSLKRIKEGVYHG